MARRRPPSWGRSVFSFLIVIYFYTVWVSNIRLKTIYLESFDTIDEDTEQACIHPILQIDHPDIIPHFKDKPQLLCAQEKDWVYTEGDVFRISSQATEVHGKITCDYHEILRLHGDVEVMTLPPNKNFKDGHTIQSDFFRANCTAADGKSYDNIHSVVAPKASVLLRPKKLQSNLAMGINVLIFGFDSVSHMTWLRNFPKTHAYMETVLDGVVLNGYNIVGDGTTAQLLAILTGQTEEELPETRRGFPNATHVDGHPWIWNEFKKNGYVTQLGEAVAYTAAFNYRLLGFYEQPMDHYIRPFYLQIDKERHKHQANCLGNRTRHNLLLEWNKDLYRTYPEHLKFSFFWHDEYTHDHNAVAEVVDDDLKKYLIWLNSEGHLDSTLLILLSDHGARFESARNTLQGRYEERMPYVSLRFPPWFKQKYPQAIRNLGMNKNRLSSPFDLHETLLDVLHFDESEQKGSISDRGISLLRRIPKERTCQDTGIELHWCACINWLNVSTNDEAVQKVAKHFVDFLNNMTAEHRDLCEQLHLGQVLNSMAIKSNEELLKFEGTIDGHGRVADLSGDVERWETSYQLKVLTKPNGALYETTIAYDKYKDKVRVDPEQISRINKYGDAPWCVEQSHPHLRQFCYCKKKKG